ncbi:MAG TPA: class I SAM-dependent methyltransferase [Solirubrobacteraceae bacterium]|nr:class I SAM-dependent methyltransferase [Solirubrobacteraceae bacterium]
MTSPGVCPACGGHLSPWRTVAPAEPAGGGPVGLLRCDRCATAVTDAPVPPEAHDTGAYATHRPRLSRTASPLLDRFDRRRLRLLGRPGPRLLDVGAGRGRFVAAARAAGFDAGGIEPSARGVRAGLEQYGVALLPAEIATAAVAPGSLDAVTLWHVLEHLDDPAAALAEIARWLRPAGVILIGVPNLASWQARIGGPRWYHLDVPRHRTHFTPRGLDLLLAGAGFDPLRATHILAEHNPFGMWQTIVNRLTRRPSYLYNLLKRNAPLVDRDLPITLAAIPLIPLAAALELAAGLAGHGGTIAVLARRRATI